MNDGDFRRSVSDSTIFALSSGPGPAAVAVLRISGPEAGHVLSRLTDKHPLVAREACLRTLRDPVTGTLLDKALVIWFPGPRSFTGEDMAELHIHGGVAVIETLMQVLQKQENLRMAEAGEFSRRAFDAGKLDLTEVEGIADLIAAQTSAQHSQAARQMAGELGSHYKKWREDIVALLAEMEAAIDFADEDLPPDLEERARERASRLLESLQKGLDDGHRGERLRDGLSVAVLGPPNVGKSSIINMLAKRDAAIVTALPGTTRDVIEVHLDLGGYPLTVADTAGLRPTEDVIEAEGISRALKRAKEADVRILMHSADEKDSASEIAALQQEGDIRVLNKIDLAAKPLATPGEIALSVKTGQGVEALLAVLTERARQALSGTEMSVVTRARHRAALEEAAQALRRFIDGAGLSTAELATEDLRMTARALGRVTGVVDVEEVLGAIFSEFCIGK